MRDFTRTTDAFIGAGRPRSLGSAALVAALGTARFHLAEVAGGRAGGPGQPFAVLAALAILECTVRAGGFGFLASDAFRGELAVVEDHDLDRLIGKRGYDDR